MYLGVANIAGKNELVFDVRDFEMLIDKYMGFEAVKIFQEFIAEREEEEEEEISDNTDLTAYELDLEHNQRAFEDIHAEAKAALEFLQKKRLELEKITKIVLRIKEICENQV